MIRQITRTLPLLLVLALITALAVPTPAIAKGDDDNPKANTEYAGVAAAGPGSQVETFSTGGPYWPRNNFPYLCFWTLPSGGTLLSGTSKVTFRELVGNNYLRRGTMKTVVSNGPVIDERVTITKPRAGYYKTTFEWTQNTGYQNQCQLDVAAGSLTLRFYRCGNGAEQFCRPAYY